MLKRNTKPVDNKLKTNQGVWVFKVLEKTFTSLKLIIHSKSFSLSEKILINKVLNSCPHIHTTNSSNKVFI